MTGGCSIKHFTAAINTAFVLASHFEPSLLFTIKARCLALELIPWGAPLGLRATLLANIRLGWKCLDLTNVLDYNINNHPQKVDTIGACIIKLLTAVIIAVS